MYIHLESSLVRSKGFGFLLLCIDTFSTCIWSSFAPQTVLCEGALVLYNLWPLSSELPWAPVNWTGAARACVIQCSSSPTPLPLGFAPPPSTQRSRKQSKDVHRSGMHLSPAMRLLLKKTTRRSNTWAPSHRLSTMMEAARLQSLSLRQYWEIAT